MMVNKVKQKIHNGEKVLGAFVGIYSPSIVEIIGYTGYDFIVIDNEHGAFSHTEIEDMIRTAELVGLVPIVRVSYDPSSIQKALDRGAKGIQVPMVNNREDAERVVNLAKFPPNGKRGAAYSVRAARFGADKGSSYFDAADDQGLVIVHIETPQAVDNFEEIVSVPGIDMAFIGSLDLSVTMGYKAEGPQQPEVQSTIQRLFQIGQQNNIRIGTVAGNAQEVADGFDLGASLIGVVGTGVIYSAFAEIMKSSTHSS